MIRAHPSEREGAGTSPRITTPAPPHYVGAYPFPPAPASKVREANCPAVSVSAAGLSLTKRQRDLLLFINGFVADKGYGPSYREMRDGLRLASHSRVKDLLAALEERGRICRLPNRSRAVWVTRPLTVQIGGVLFAFIPKTMAT